MSQRQLEDRIRALEIENARLKALFQSGANVQSVIAGPPFDKAMAQASTTVYDFFSQMYRSQETGVFSISGERHVFIRSASLSKGLYDSVYEAYKDRGDDEARAVAINFIFNFSHSLGRADAKAFHEKFGLDDPVQKLAVGPSYFYHAGFAQVELLEGCNLSPDDDFFLHYRHQNSFEQQSWGESGDKAKHPVDIMNAGYSSGWCSESYNMDLVAVEYQCRAMGDQNCSFIMAPARNIQRHLDRLGVTIKYPGTDAFNSIPTYFQRKDLEDALRRARDDAVVSKQELRYLIAGIAHDLRSPLVALRGFSYELQNSLGEGSDESAKEALGYVMGGAGLIQEMIEDLLILSRAEDGSIVTEKESYSLRSGLDAIANMVSKHHDVGKKGLEFRSVYDPQVAPRIETDATLFARIMLNLIGNAYKFANNFVEYGFRLAGDQIEFYVRDDGPGIPMDHQKSIFSPYSQTDAGQRIKGSCGLGLMAAKNIVEILGGDIAVSSKEGNGATFHFRLPYTPSEGTDTKYQPPAMRKTVLVVDDDLPSQKVLEKRLANAGYEVIVARNGTDAISRYLSGPVHLIFMDMQMPGMSGEDTIRVLRSKPQYQERAVPIVCYTADATYAQDANYAGAGCDDYLIKPVKLEVLEKIIARHLDGTS